MANRNKSDEKIRYLVREGGRNFGGDDGKHFVIEVPASWKVTFANVNPNAPSGGNGGHCLRIYEGEKLRAVYCDIVGFRDLSIPFAREVAQSVGKRDWEADSEGNFSGKTEIKVNRRLEGTLEVDANEVDF